MRMRSPTMTMEDLLAAADEAAAVISRGGLALVPADIGYGLLGHSRASIARMYELKGRSGDNPCIVAANVEILKSIALLPDTALIDWLADVSQEQTIAVVVRVRPDAPLVAGLDPWVREHTVTNGTAAVFLRPGPFVERMVSRASERGMLLVGSSGNESGTGNNYRFADVPAAIREEVDFRLDAGTMLHVNDAKLATTIVNLTNFTLRRVGVRRAEIVRSYEEFARRRPDLPASLFHQPRDAGRRRSGR